VWIDYVSIPQLNPSLQRLAIDTLAVYASTCHFFVALAPTVVHADTGAVCDADTYASRGFCRLEQWARLIVGGDGARRAVRARAHAPRAPRTPLRAP
jgi:hypothetical protein